MSSSIYRTNVGGMLEIIYLRVDRAAHVEIRAPPPYQPNWTGASATNFNVHNV